MLCFFKKVPNIYKRWVRSFSNAEKWESCF